MNARADFHDFEDDRRDNVRLPPHSVDAEQAVLGGLMLEPHRWDQIADLIKPDDFYRRDHQLIFRAIQTLTAADKRVDVVTVSDWIESQGKLEQVAGGAYVTELATGTISAANVRAYAEIVADKAMRRRVIDVATDLVNHGFDQRSGETLELVGRAQTRLSDLLEAQPCELEPVAPVMDRVFSRLEERSRHEGGVHGISTGINDLDDVLGGLKPGGLYLLAARPKMGKTTFAQNIAEHVALKLKLPVAVFSFEMQPDELGDRMLSSIGGVDGDRVRRGELDDVDWANVTRAMKTLRGAEIYVSRPRSARVEHVSAQTRRQHARKPLGLGIIDYLQLMETDGDNRAQGIGDITRKLKLLAGELGIPLVLLSQLNRSLETRTDKRPIPSDLRDSGAIEQDADAVIFIYRDEIYDRNSRYKGTAEIDVAMQRNGPPAMVRALYEPNLFRFSNLPDSWEPEPLPDKEPKSRPRKGLARALNKGPAQEGAE